MELLEECMCPGPLAYNIYPSKDVETPGSITVLTPICLKTFEHEAKNPTSLSKPFSSDISPLDHSPVLLSKNASNQPIIEVIGFISHF